MQFMELAVTQFRQNWPIWCGRTHIGAALCQQLFVSRAEHELQKKQKMSPKSEKLVFFCTKTHNLLVIFLHCNTRRNKSKSGSSLGGDFGNWTLNSHVPFPVGPILKKRPINMKFNSTAKSWNLRTNYKKNSKKISYFIIIRRIFIITF